MLRAYAAARPGIRLNVMYSGAEFASATGTEGGYALVNDPALTQRAAEALVRELGPQQVKDVPPEMASEDFSQYQRAGVPTLMLRVGVVERAKYTEALKSGAILPSLHSALFGPASPP
jgi:metal-dependent amidase/aminoacylase/carboxypeptidase family protein